MVQVELGNRSRDDDAYVKPLVIGEVAGAGILRHVIDLPGIGAQESRRVLNGLVGSGRPVAKEKEFVVIFRLHSKSKADKESLRIEGHVGLNGPVLKIEVAHIGETFHQVEA